MLLMIMFTLFICISYYLGDLLIGDSHSKLTAIRHAHKKTDEERTRRQYRRQHQDQYFLLRGLLLPNFFSVFRGAGGYPMTNGMWAMLLSVIGLQLKRALPSRGVGEVQS